MPSKNLRHAIDSMRSMAGSKADAMGASIGGQKDVSVYAQAMVGLLIDTINSNIQYEAVRARLINGISISRISPMLAYVEISAPVISDIINGNGEEADLARLHRKGFVVKKHVYFRGKDKKPHPLFGTGVPNSRYLDDAASRFNAMFAGQATCSIVS